MKTITQLTGTVGASEMRDPRGVITALALQDPNCKGWFIEVSLSPSGLRFKAKRPNGAVVGITIDDLLALARAQAPELFADEATVAKVAAAQAKVAGT